jgi:hypothetical protein
MTILCLDHAYIRSFVLSALLDDSVDVDKNVKVCWTIMPASAPQMQAPFLLQYTP